MRPCFKLFVTFLWLSLSSLLDAAAHIVLLGNQYHHGVLVPEGGVFDLCGSFLVDGLCQLTHVPGSGSSRILHCGDIVNDIM